MIASAPFEAQLGRVAETLVQDASAFVAMHRGRTLSEESALRLMVVLNGQGLWAFAIELRQCLVALIGGADGFDSTPYWAMIDAIRFFGDAHPGRWPYTTDNDWNRYLLWATEFSALALSSSIN